jgi:hypothetical protein
VEKYVCYEGKDRRGGCKRHCEGCESFAIDRRKKDRRHNSVSFRVRERREGFDRRQNHITRKGFYHFVFRRGSLHLRHNQIALLILLIVFNLLSIADYMFTLKALNAGFAEGNPIMDAMFTVGPAVAACFKIGLTMFVAAMVWLFRRYRAILEISILFILMYMLLIIYHIYGAIRFY